MLFEAEDARAASDTISRENGSRLRWLARASSNLSVKRRLFRSVDTVELLNAEKSWNVERKECRMADRACMHVEPPHVPECRAHAAKAQMTAITLMVGMVVR